MRARYPHLAVHHGLAHDPALRSGELSDGWTLLFVIGWSAVAIGYAAIWRASWQLGIPTWWLAHRGSGIGSLLAVAPFLPPAAMIVAAARRVRHLPWWGLAASLTLLAIALADLGNIRGLSVAGIVVALSGALISLASLTGMYRATEPSR